MNTRRNFLKTSVLGAGFAAFNPYLSPLYAGKSNSGHPKRFIFIRKSNGTWPKVYTLPTFSEQEKAKEKNKEPFEADLDKHELPDWLKALTPHKENMTVLQGLSTKMSENGHGSGCSVMGCFKSQGNTLSAIKRATIDFELGNLFPAAFKHVEMSFAGRGRGGIQPGFSAPGPHQRNYCYADPRTAYNTLFKSVLNPGIVQSDIQMLDYVKDKESLKSKSLSAKDENTFENHVESLQTVMKRNQELLKMSAKIKAHMPKLGGMNNTVQKQNTATEIIAAALITGLTNVVTYTIDDLLTNYSGIKGMGTTEIDLHALGHNRSFNQMPAPKVRENIRTHHIKQVKTLVEKLKAQPEGNGTMFDNTMIMYFPEGGEAHHGSGIEAPFLIMSGKNCELDIAGRYIRLPYHCRPGHKTLGNWYTTLLNAHGNPIPHYGDLDIGMVHSRLPQEGPIKRFMS